MKLTDEIFQFDNKTKLAHSGSIESLQTIKSFKNVLMNTKALTSICIEVTRTHKHKVTRNIYEAVFEGIAQGSSLMNKLELRQLALEYLLSLLIKWNSSLTFSFKKFWSIPS